MRLFERAVFLRFDSKDNAICSKFNFGVVVVSKESNQEVIFMHYAYNLQAIIDDDHKSVAFSSSIRDVCLSPSISYSYC